MDAAERLGRATQFERQAELLASAEELLDHEAVSAEIGELLDGQEHAATEAEAAFLAARTDPVPAAEALDLADVEVRVVQDRLRRPKGLAQPAVIELRTNAKVLRARIGEMRRARPGMGYPDDEGHNFVRNG
ncbi:hypothetical protein [Kribbia dieselivorans]|uniref:hypothetical protein n=1 Tax=Kribbia dieselivorans TaxID=331526 RepID=UPI00083873CB|nr:hypothetical protein [Kribbia dieselivorans]